MCNFGRGAMPRLFAFRRSAEVGAQKRGGENRLEAARAAENFCAEFGGKREVAVWFADKSRLCK